MGWKQIDLNERTDIENRPCLSMTKEELLAEIEKEIHYLSLKVRLIETESPNRYLITLITTLISIAPFMANFQVVVNMLNVLTSILAAMLLYYLVFSIILLKDLINVSLRNEERRNSIQRYKKLISDLNKLQFIVPIKWISLLYLSISVILGGIVFALLVTGQNEVKRLIEWYILTVVGIHILGAIQGYFVGYQISDMLSPNQAHKSKPVVRSKSLVNLLLGISTILLAIGLFLWFRITYQNLKNNSNVGVAIIVMAAVYFIVFLWLIPYSNKHEASNILKTQLYKLLELADELRYKSEKLQIDEYSQKFLEILAWITIKKTKKHFWEFYEFQPNPKYESWLLQQEQTRVITEAQEKTSSAPSEKEKTE